MSAFFFIIMAIQISLPYIFVVIIAIYVKYFLERFKMLNFFNACSIFCETVIVNRKEATDRITLSGKLSHEISNMIQKHRDYFDEYEKVIVYYDND